MKTKQISLSILFALLSLIGLCAQEKAFDPTLSAVPEDIEKWMDEELAKVQKEPIQDYESDKFFSREPAKIIGYIKGYDPQVGFNTGINYASNQLTREDYPVTIEIKPDGRFEAEIPLIHPITSYIVFNNKIVDFYLEPGQTLGMVLDWKKFLEAERHNSRYYPQDAVVFKGKLARINEEFTNFDFSPFNYSDFKENILTLHFEDLRKQALEEKKENEKLIAKYISEKDLLEKTKILLTNNKELITATRILNYIMYKRDFQQQYPDNEILKEEISVEQYSFLQNVPMNKQSLLINRNFSEFVNRVEFSKPLLYYPEQKPYTADYMAPWHKKDSVMTNHLHLDNDLVYDITKTRSLKYLVDRITEADQAYKYWNDLSATIENEFLKEEGERIIQAKFPKKKENLDGINSPAIAIKAETIPLPRGEAKNLFYNIADKHKGKILFIDFWATSCGPCIGTIKSMKETRKKYKDNPDFDFVFITDQAQSPLKSYEKFTKQQELENIYRVDTDTYNRFRQLFKFNGIPKYVVLNKDGEVIDDDFQMYRFNFELSEILRKNK